MLSGLQTTRPIRLAPRAAALRRPIARGRPPPRPRRPAGRGRGGAAPPRGAGALRAEPREVDETSERQERLVRRDVRRRLLAPDVLLPCLQREDIAALARGVYRLADDSPRHAADVILSRREEPVVRPAVRLEVPCGLALADGDRAAV